MRVQDEVEQLMKDLYPNLDGGITHTYFDNLLEEEQNVEFFLQPIEGFLVAIIPQFKSSKAFLFDKIASY